ncbi:hypothetical protein HaLaN_19513 [Haematococcus lacustris]|uniref:Uncharacterized protein n=1 Tax=Haematococcus lacustris TaxID=44745 RepID=A0A6A0A0B0_HAELA|nr:hypothetical protein HaLaN_19513 [Haematococcus lacustris]
MEALVRDKGAGGRSRFGIWEYNFVSFQYAPAHECHISIVTPDGNARHLERLCHDEPVAQVRVRVPAI